jgi:diaminopimelate epimerase
MAKAVCNEQKGIGADGLLILSEGGSGYRVDVYNADGSWAEKSGNGLRMAAMHLAASGKVDTDNFILETGSGQSAVVLKEGTDASRVVSASLGSPEFEAAKIPVKSKSRYFINQTIKLAGRSYLASAVSVGNPHLILFCDDFDFDWKAVGEKLESHQLFPKRINVGFVVPVSAKKIKVRDWERGVGPTGSSGTGAAAAVAVAVMRGFIEREVTVSCPAGEMEVLWKKGEDDIWISGPVEKVAEGEFEL